MSLEEADHVSPRRCLSLILVFFQSPPLGEATIVNLQKDKPTTNSPNLLCLFIALWRKDKDKATYQGSTCLH